MWHGDLVAIDTPWPLAISLPKVAARAIFSVHLTNLLPKITKVICSVSSAFDNYMYCVHYSTRKFSSLVFVSFVKLRPMNFNT